MALANMTQEQTNRENFEHCKRIGNTVEAYANGNVYKCPECGDEMKLPTSVGDKFKCPHCHSVNNTDEWEQMGLYDYFSDILDSDYLVNHRKEYKGCRILVAYGGPNIYIDTTTAYVELYWWTDTAKYRLSSETVEAIDEWAEEYFNCL